MANGDAAVAAGLSVVASTADRRLGYDEINKTRDMIVQRIFPLSQGGLGATTAAGGRTTLGLGDIATMASTAFVQQGGTDVGQMVISAASGSNAGRPQVFQGGTFKGFMAYLSDISTGSFVSKSGDTMSGDLYLQSCSPVTSSYAAMYRNGDGRVGVTPSARRFKENIRTLAARELGDVWPDFREFQLIGGDGQLRYGPIADDMLEHPDQARFVVLDGDGQPLTIDFTMMLVVQVAQLHERVRALEAAAS